MTSEQNSQNIEGFVTLHIPCRFSYLRIVRQSISNLCVHAGLSEFKAAQLEMAVDEACSSIIGRNAASEPADEHDPERQGLRLNLIQQKEAIVVELYDYGIPLNFETNEVVEPEQYADNPEGQGLGMYVIKRFVDEIHYEPETRSGNYLRLKKII
jgi:anti-sigma regulatory factor (Ser/Thr protein kinase)